MKFVKIITSALLLAALAVSMIACGGEAAETTAAAGTTAAPTQTTAKKSDSTTTAAPATEAPVTTAAPDTTGIIDVDAWGGFWSLDQSTGHLIMDNRGDGTDFGMYPVDGKIEEGKTKYTVSVKYVWNSSEKEKCIFFAIKDVDGDGEIRENYDVYLGVFGNGCLAYATTHMKWDGVWLPAAELAGPENGTIVKLTVVLDTAANNVTATLSDAETGDVYGNGSWEVDLTDTGEYFAIGSKVNGSEYWDIEFSAE